MKTVIFQLSDNKYQTNPLNLSPPPVQNRVKKMQLDLCGRSKVDVRLGKTGKPFLPNTFVYFCFITQRQ